MPSPVGHSMIGLAVGLAYCWPRGRWTGNLYRMLYPHRFVLLLVLFMANVPDLDYLPGLFTGDLNAYHHQYTHTLGWMVLVGMGVWCCWKYVQPAIGWREAVLLLAAVGSHLVADCLTDDGSYPYGIMLLWPVTEAYMIFPFPIFPRPMKSDWMDLFSIHNVLVMWKEFWITLPLVLAVVLFKRIARPRVPMQGLNDSTRKDV